MIASVRMVWDLADPHAGVPVLARGVSGNVASPHWADQRAAYRDGDAAAGRWRPDPHARRP